MLAIEILCKHDPLPVKKLTLSSNVSGTWTLDAMNRIDANHFAYSHLQPAQEFWMNLNASVADNESHWLVTPYGIRGVEWIKINDVLLNRTFLTQGTDGAAFMTINVSNGVQRGGGADIPPANIPCESPFPLGRKRFDVPPAGFLCATGWANVMQLDGNVSPSRVLIKNFTLKSKDANGSVKTLLNTSYTTPPQNAQWYGLYSRWPYFYGDRLSQMPATYSSAGMTLTPHKNTNRVYHFWQHSRCLIPAGTKLVWAEMQLSIEGQACVQIGIDAWKNMTIPYGGVEVNNTEMCASRWLCGPQSEKILSSIV